MCCFNHIIGLPQKHGKKMPLFDYEQKIFEAIADYRYVWIKKATGLGVTEFMCRFISWLCLKDDTFKGTQMCIVTGPRIDLAVTLIDRIKRLFPEIIFETKETMVELNGVTIEAFPSHHLDTMRGLQSPSLIFLDEADFFPPGQQQDARGVSERYIGKSDPYIIMVSTPNAPEGLFETIEKEPDDICLYHRIKLPYAVGLEKIYTEQEIAAARESPSFEREYNLKYIGQQGNVFSPSSIERATELGEVLEEKRKGTIPPHADKSMGLDPGFGSSKFGIVVTQIIGAGMAEVLYSEEFDKPDFNYMLDVIKKIRSNFGIKMVFIDDMNPELIRALKAVYNEKIDYKKDMEWIRSKKLELYEWMNIIPVSFRSEHRELLSHVKMILDAEALAISATTHNKLLVALRTAYAVDGDLKKDITSHNDLLDALMLSCKLWVVDH